MGTPVLQALNTKTTSRQAFSLLRRHSSMNMQRMKRTFLAEISGHHAHRDVFNHMGTSQTCTPAPHAAHVHNVDRLVTWHNRPRPWHLLRPFEFCHRRRDQGVQMPSEGPKLRSAPSDLQISHDERCVLTTPMRQLHCPWNETPHLSEPGLSARWRRSGSTWPNLAEVELETSR